MGASTLILGTMEGFADFAASSLDLASGYASDRIGKRKGLAVFGYALSSTAKIVLLLAATTAQVFAFRFDERLGKSIRGASFGVHKAFDKAGAIVGPFVAFAFLDHFGQSLGSFRKLFLVAVFPAFASVAVLALFVPERKDETTARRVPLREAIRTLGPGFRALLDLGRPLLGRLLQLPLHSPRRSPNARTKTGARDSRRRFIAASCAGAPLHCQGADRGPPSTSRRLTEIRSPGRSRL